MSNRISKLAVLIAVALFVRVASAGDIISGPQLGETVHGFNPLNCTGEHAGEKHCLICQNGANPVAIIFARQVTPELTKLIQRIDRATEENKKSGMGSFVVLLSDSDSLETELKALAKKERIQHSILTIDNPDGPQGYNIAQEADVTVVLYVKQTIKANHAFKKGEFTDKGIETIVADLAKILTN
jgi:hypothetical protein